MNKSQTLNNFWAGLLAGVFFPALLFFFYWAFFHNQLSFPVRFIAYLRGGGDMFSNVIKICGLGNLLLFYYGLNKKYDRFTKGVIVSVLLYVLLVAYIIYFVEPRGY